MNYLVIHYVDDEEVVWEFDSLSEACALAQDIYDADEIATVEDSAGFEYDIFSSSRLAY